MWPTAGKCGPSGEKSEAGPDRAEPHSHSMPRPRKSPDGNEPRRHEPRREGSRQEEPGRAGQRDGPTAVGCSERQAGPQCTAEPATDRLSGPGEALETGSPRRLRPRRHRGYLAAAGDGRLPRRASGDRRLSPHGRSPVRAGEGPRSTTGHDLTGQQGSGHPGGDGPPSETHPGREGGEGSGSLHGAGPNRDRRRGTARPRGAVRSGRQCSVPQAHAPGKTDRCGRGGLPGSPPGPPGARSGGSSRRSRCGGRARPREARPR